MINSNLSNREAYAQYGKLDDARMEALFDAEDDLNAMSGNEGAAQEASAQYPDEDFLQDNIKALQALAKNIRGDNKATLLEIISSLEGIQLNQGHATECGREELRKIK